MQLKKRWRQFWAKWRPATQACPECHSLKDTLWSGLFSGLTLLIIAELSLISGSPWLMAPFGASILLVFSVPESDFSQPRNVIFGHLLSAAIGFGCLWLLGDGMIALVVAMSAVVVLSSLARLIHAPAAGTPIIIISNQPDWTFLFFPVLFGAVVIVMAALLLNNLLPDRQYPRYW